MIAQEPHYVCTGTTRRLITSHWLVVVMRGLPAMHFCFSSWRWGQEVQNGGGGKWERGAEKWVWSEEWVFLTLTSPTLPSLHTATSWKLLTGISMATEVYITATGDSSWSSPSHVRVHEVLLQLLHLPQEALLWQLLHPPQEALLLQLFHPPQEGVAHLRCPFWEGLARVFCHVAPHHPHHHNVRVCTSNALHWQRVSRVPWWQQGARWRWCTKSTPSAKDSLHPVLCGKGEEVSIWLLQMQFKVNYMHAYSTYQHQQETLVHMYPSHPSHTSYVRISTSPTSHLSSSPCMLASYLFLVHNTHLISTTSLSPNNIHHVISHTLTSYHTHSPHTSYTHLRPHTCIHLIPHTLSSHLTHLPHISQ